jgi:hypothetical protein
LKEPQPKKEAAFEEPRLRPCPGNRSLSHSPIFKNGFAAPVPDSGAKTPLGALFLLVSIFPKLFFALVGRNFAQLAFSSAGHFSVSLSKVGPIPGFSPGPAGK